MPSTGSARRVAIDGGIKVLLLTALAYLAAFIYEISYLDHFGIPVAFVDVSIRELLLCGVACFFCIAVIMWLDILWGAMPARFPPILAKYLMLFAIGFLVITLLSALLDVPILLWAIVACAILLVASALLFAPLIRYRHMPSIAGKLWAQYGHDNDRTADQPKLLWFSVPNSFIAAIVVLFLTCLFAFAVGRCHARVQTRFAVRALGDSCAVLRLSSDGYLCVGIDFHTRRALGTLRFLDPKGVELNVMNIGRIAPFISAPRPISTVPSPQAAIK